MVAKADISNFGFPLNSKGLLGYCGGFREVNNRNHFGQLTNYAYGNGAVTTRLSLISKIDNLMKTILLFLLWVFLFWIDIFSQPYNHTLIEEQYRKRYEQLDTNVYYNTVLRIGRYYSGELSTVAISVSRDVEGVKTLFFLDSLIYFHKNGHLRFIQARDSIGTPTFTRMYDKNGNLIRECKFTYTGVIPYLQTDKTSRKALMCYGKKYKNGILVSEGLTIGGKKDGLHIIYDKNGTEKSRRVYSSGK